MTRNQDKSLARRLAFLCLAIIVCFGMPAVLKGQSPASLQLKIPRLGETPALEDFLGMVPSSKTTGGRYL